MQLLRVFYFWEITFILEGISNLFFFFGKEVFLIFELALINLSDAYVFNAFNATDLATDISPFLLEFNFVLVTVTAS